MSRYLVWILIIILSITNVYGKTKKIESMHNVYKKLKKDNKHKIDILNELSSLVHIYNLEKARNYALDAENMSIKRKYDIGLVESYLNQGVTYSRIDNNKALELFNKGVTLSSEIKYNNGSVQSLLFIGNINMSSGRISFANSC